MSYPTVIIIIIIVIIIIIIIIIINLGSNFLSVWTIYF